MSKSVSHYLRDYLKLTDSAKFNLIGGFGVERKLTPAEEGNMNTTVLKFLKLKVPAPGPNDVFKYEIKSAADFTAAPVAGYANYGEFIQDFKDVQKAIVQKFLDDADAAAAPAAAAPAGAAAAAPFMGGRRSKQYGGNPAGIPPLKEGAAVAGVVAGLLAIHPLIAALTSTPSVEMTEAMLISNGLTVAELLAVFQAYLNGLGLAGATLMSKYESIAGVVGDIDTTSPANKLLKESLQGALADGP